MQQSRSGERRGWIVIAALFAPLVVLVAAAGLTWRAERRYEIVTQRVVHDYAAIAAWQYARRANNVLHDEAMQAFRGIIEGHQRSAHGAAIYPPDRILSARSDTGPALLAHARFAFTFDVGTGRLATAGGAVDDATRAMIERRLRHIARTTAGDAEPHRVLFDSSGGAEHAIALWTLAAPDAPISGAYGVVSDAAALAPRFAAIVGEANMLPMTAAGARLTANDLAIRLVKSDGGVVFATSRLPGATAATDTAGLHLNGLHAIVDIPPHMIDALLVGGAPSSLMPPLVLMIVLAATLAIIGTRHEWRARELGRLRTRFVANVSHELRTPLAQISMFAETLTLGRERNEAERRQFASIIFAEARRLTALVESVLRFSRGDADRLRTERLAVSAEIEGATTAFAPIAEAMGASVRIHSGPEVHALLDAAAFRQVMLNLLDNAVKHGGRGTVIEISVAADADGVRIVVDDSGPGVPIEWREKVFEPFVRLDRAKSAGAGIGLAVVRDLVTAQGGRVRIEDSPLGGARFVIMIPAAAPVDEPAVVHERANV